MLHVPVGTNTFGLTQASWGTTRPAAANGTVVTPVVGSKGSWAQLISSVTADAYGVLVNINSNSASAANRNSVVDIGIDESGGTSYAVAIPDLLGGAVGAYTVVGVWYYFPLFVPAGSRIAARAQSTVTNAFRVGCQLFERPSNPAQIRKGGFVEAIGVSGVSGTSVTGGTTTEGAWTSLGTTTERLWWWQLGLQIDVADTNWNVAALHVDLAVGNGSSYDVIIADALITATTAEALTNPPLSAGVEWSVPAGSTMYARIQSSGALDPYQVSAYGLGG
jgi:hypothetical protein